MLVAGLENAIGFQLLGQYDLDDVPLEAHAAGKEGFMHESNPVYDHPVKLQKLADEEGVYGKSVET